MDEKDLNPSPQTADDVNSDAPVLPSEENENGGAAMPIDENASASGEEAPEEELPEALSEGSEDGYEENSAEYDEEEGSEDYSEEEYSDDEADEDDYDEDLERERLREIRKKKKRRKKTHGRLVFALVMTTVIISASILCAAGVITVAKEILGLGRADTELAVEIPENASTEEIAEILLEEGVIGNAKIFRVVSKIRGGDGFYMAGSHKLTQNMPYSDIIEELCSEAINDREFVDITFPEGIRLIEAADKLEEAGVCSASDFIYTFNSSVFGFDFEEHVKTSSMKFYKMEGYFFPDTYRFYLDEDPKTVAKKVCKNFEYKITPDYYGRMDDLGLTLEETLTLASIVQREASHPTDMKLVASVFHNRLNNPDTFPLLQSDPTSGYVRDVIKPNIEVKSQKMFDAYDTYVGAGLPPGPICNPGIDAIEAVLYPRETDYFFFCSDLETEEFFFARTLEEHEENLVKANLA
ncbi:MAG: endolytic transglycosylase MltG [Huintestinicola sp.]